MYQVARRDGHHRKDKDATCLAPAPGTVALPATPGTVDWLVVKNRSACVLEGKHVGSWKG